LDQNSKSDQLNQQFRALGEQLLDCEKLFNCSGSLPSTYAVAGLMDSLKQLLFPRFYHREIKSDVELKLTIPLDLGRVYTILKTEIHKAFAFEVGPDQAGHALDERSETLTLELLNQLPRIRRELECDLEEVLNHDPAAKGIEEVLLAYPGFEAITAHRLAHFLYQKALPLLPRMMSEWVHRRTGIDIHPGAQIAPYCSIDHGTGLIIGETTIIGRHVNLFHNVTLGARSVTPEFRGCKRHPTIGENVIIYPGATILGDIRVGDNSVIGGNVFLLESCLANSKIYAKPPEIIIRKKDDV